MLDSYSLDSRQLQSDYVPYKKYVNSVNLDRIPGENQGQGILLENQNPPSPQSKEEIYDAIHETDRHLETCWYAFYRTWVGILMVVSFIGMILGAVVTLIVKFTYIYLVGVFGCAWNTSQLYEEYQAIACKDIEKAKKAMHFFRGFMGVIPLLFLMASMIEGLKWTTVILSVVGFVLIFYFFVVFGGQMVLKKLEHREELKKRLEIWNIRQ